MNDNKSNDLYSIRGLAFHIDSDEHIIERSAQEGGVQTSTLRNMDTETSGGLLDL